MILEEIEADKLVPSHVSNYVRSCKLELIISLWMLTDHLFKNSLLCVVELAKGLRETSITFRDVLLRDNGHIVRPHLANPALLTHDPAEFTRLAAAEQNFLLNLFIEFFADINGSSKSIELVRSGPTKTL